MHSMSEYKEWAGEIANTYLRSGVAPTETLVKIACSIELQPHEIDTLAAEANKTIHHAKYASQNDKYFAADFPLADAKTAKEKLAMVQTKVASFGFIDPIIEAEIPDYHKMMGVEPEVFDKTASVKHDVRGAIEKLEMFQEKIADARILIENTIANAEISFIKEAQSHMLGLNGSAERMRTLGVLDYTVKLAGFTNTGRKTLYKLAYYLASNGMLSNQHAQIAKDYFLKEAGSEAPLELISDRLPGQVINGTHPIYITLKTIEDNAAKNLIYNNENEKVQTKLKLLKERVKVL